MSTISQTSDVIANGYQWIRQDCPICEIPPTKFLGKRGGASHREGTGIETEIWACGKCSLIFPNPMPVPVNGLEQHYDASAEHFFDNHDMEKKVGFASKILKTIENLLGSTGKLLDIGAGRGEIVKRAKLDGWQPIGLEPTESFAKIAEEFSGVEIRRQKVEECNFADGEFDAVILSAVLEHLYNPDEVVAEISRILRPGGVFYFDVPNERGLFFQAGSLYQKLRLRNWCVNLSPTFSPFHLFGFSPKAARALLNKHGLEPKVWNVYGGTSYVPPRGGAIGKVESQIAKAVTAISDLGEMGTYMEVWAVKK